MIPKGWTIKKHDDGTIVVGKHGLGGVVASGEVDSIAATILHALARDILAETTEDAATLPPSGYAMISTDALKAWGKYDEEVAACQYPLEKEQRHD